MEPLPAARQITNILVDQGAKIKAEIDSSGTNKLYPRIADIVGMAIASTGSSYPPSVQERIFQLLDAFVSLGPIGKIPNQLVLPNGEFGGDPDLKDVLNSRPFKPLWESLEVLNLANLCQWLADLGVKWSGIEKRSSEEQYRWRNMSYFFARLSKEGKEDLCWISALRSLEPSRRIPKNVPGWSGFLAGQAITAAQWIIPEGHGAWVRKKFLEAVPSGKLSEDTRYYFMIEKWDVWKAAFVELAELQGDVRVPKEAIEAATKSVEIMRYLEIEVHG